MYVHDLTQEPLGVLVIQYVSEHVYYQYPLILPLKGSPILAK